MKRQKISKSAFVGLLALQQSDAQAALKAAKPSPHKNKQKASMRQHAAQQVSASSALAALMGTGSTEATPAHVPPEAISLGKILISPNLMWNILANLPLSHTVPVYTHNREGNSTVSRVIGHLASQRLVADERWQGCLSMGARTFEARLERCPQLSSIANASTHENFMDRLYGKREGFALLDGWEKPKRIKRDSLTGEVECNAPLVILRRAVFKP